MHKIIIIKKNGDVEEKNVKSIDLETVYKFCNYKSNKDFEHLHTFTSKHWKYMIFGKRNGKANQENKYELPPPIDSELFFGSLCVLKCDETDEFQDLLIDEWNKVYEELFGGFEDIENDDETRSVDSEVYSDEDYTNEGYLKDGFVVDDDELEEEDYIEYDDN